jgi:hypothetical protein
LVLIALGFGVAISSWKMITKTKAWWFEGLISILVLYYFSTWMGFMGRYLYYFPSWMGFMGRYFV